MAGEYPTTTDLTAGVTRLKEIGGIKYLPPQYKNTQKGEAIRDSPNAHNTQ